jgi:hypothetical protein
MRLSVDVGRGFGFSERTLMEKPHGLPPPHSKELCFLLLLALAARDILTMPSCSYSILVVRGAAEEAEEILLN